MSNSSLVSYTKLSPNYYKGRTHSIDTITIHCFVGQVTVERGCEVFANTSRQASCNYVVAKDGKIGLVVDEENGSWCSSNKANDMRAITIECASDTTEPYLITDSCMSSLIKLCADICKRNNIPKLVWSADKNTRVNHLNGCNMTCHRDFANKSCPGTYIYSKESTIADEVNKILDGSSATVTPASKPTTSVPDITYAVKIGTRSLPFVKNLEDYAGLENQKITGVAIKLSSGDIKYRVHILGGGWLPYVTGCDFADYNNGYAGNGKIIDAIQIVSTSNKIKYRVSPVGTSNYYSWQFNGETTNGQDGYAGCFGKAIDKLQMIVVS